MDYIEAIQLKAAAAFLRPDRNSLLRHVCRWYSKTFSTPLHVVEDLPIEDVLTAYFEESIDQLDDEGRSELFDKLAMTSEEREALEAEETATGTKVEKADEEFFEKLNSEAAHFKSIPKERPKLKYPKSKPAKDQKEEAPPSPPGPDIRLDFGGNLLDEVGDLDPLSFKR